MTAGSAHRIGRVRLPFAVDRSCDRTLSDQVLGGFRSAILNGFWKTGAVLPSRRAISDSLGVSENVVRAALSRLAAEGMILPRTGTGCLVLQHTHRKIRGLVLQVFTGNPGSRSTTVFSYGLHNRLRTFGIRCTNICVPLGGNGLLDYSWLKDELLHLPDIVVLHSNGLHAPGTIRILEKSGVPYVGILPNHCRCGAHCLATIPYETAPAITSFARDCSSSGVLSANIFKFEETRTLNLCRSLLGRGIAVEEITVEGDHQIEIAQRNAACRMAERLRRGPLCDLVFFCDDYLAQGALPVLLERGVRIPEDVKIVSITNRGFCPAFPRPLAQIRYDFKVVAEQVADALFDWFKHGTFAQDLKIIPEYVSGGTFPVGRHN